MTSEIAAGGVLPLSVLGELRGFSIVDVREEGRLQGGIVDISHLSFRVRMDNKSMEHEHPATK
jgi:hypothetical protein